MSYVYGAAPNAVGPTTVAPFTVPTGTAAAIAVSPAASSGTYAKQAVIVQADPSNSGTVYVGDPSTTTASGMALVATASMTFPVADASKLYAIGSAPGQILRIAYV